MPSGSAGDCTESFNELVALTRVTTSEYGYPAPGYAEACRLLKENGIFSVLGHIVGLEDDSAAEIVQHQRLLGFGKAEFPGKAGVLDRS